MKPNNESTIMQGKVKTLKGYSIQSTDGETIGTAKEFYFDDRHWTVRYVVANTGNWLTGCGHGCRRLHLRAGFSALFSTRRAGRSFAGNSTEC